MAKDAEKKFIIIKGEISSPPMGEDARKEAFALVRQLQKGNSLGLPHSRPMRCIGSGCHELRITDKQCIWRVVYLLEPDAVVVLEVFSKKSQQTPKHVIENCKQRVKRYRQA